MASSQKIVTLDVGWSTLKLSEFAVNRTGAVTLLRFGHAELGLDPNKDEDRAQFITQALAELFRKTGIKDKQLRVSVSGHLIFTKFIKLPNVEASQLEKIVGFEAQQNVPFPMNEVVWDYQMLVPKPGGIESECVLVAIKKEVLEVELGAVEAAGAVVTHVDVAPFALLNAFRFSVQANEGCSLMINVGAKSTNFIFVEGDRFWIRTIPIAGHLITQNMCNEMQEPFVASETLKRGKGFVSLGGVYADPPDETAARISKLIRTTMTKLHIELNRSAAAWRTNYGGSAPVKAYLYGGGAEVQYTNFFIEDKLNIPVEYFNPLANVNVAPSANPGSLVRDYIYVGDGLGVALRLTGSSPVEISLEAPRIVARKQQAQVRPYYLIALAMWLLVMVGVNLYFAREIQLLQPVLDQKTEEAANVQRLSGLIKPTLDEYTSLQAMSDSITDLGQDRTHWLRILNALNDKITLGMWITQLEPIQERGAPSSAFTPGPQGQRHQPGQQNAAESGSNMLDIHGLYMSSQPSMPNLSPTDVTAFFSSLKGNPDFDIGAEVRPEMESQTSNPDALSFAFAYKLKLKQPLRMTPGK